jgi:hypothetical protein
LLAEIGARQAITPAECKLEQLKQDVAAAPPELRKPLANLLLLAEGATTDGFKMREHRSTATERRVLFAVGLGLLLLLVYLAVAIPTPTPSQEKTFLVVLGLGGAAFGAMLPGAIAVEGKRPGVRIRATGAIGFATFIIVVYKNLL